MKTFKNLFFFVVLMCSLALNGQVVTPLPGQKITDLQVLSIRNDTIFLKYGGFVKLPSVSTNNLGTTDQVLTSNRTITGGGNTLKVNGKFGVNKTPEVDFEVLGQMRVELSTLPAIFLNQTSGGTLGPLIVYQNPTQVYRMSLNYQNSLGSDNFVFRDQTAGSNIFEVSPGASGIFYLNRELSLQNKKVTNAADATTPTGLTTQQQVDAKIAALIRSGSGSPEGTVTASPGTLYLNTAGGLMTTLYVKESGTGNTGWVGK